MDTVQTLITRYLLDPKGYESGAKVVEGVTKNVTGAIEALRGGIIGGLHSALRTVFSPIAALAGGAGLIALAHSAVKTAIAFDTIERSLQAVTGSAERAKAILAFDDQLAGPSIFTSEDLAKASLTLEAFKLKTEEFLPVVERIATVFGGNTEALQQFTDALGYIANGRFGEGFESLTRAGFSRADFEAKGLQFDKGGSYTGSSEDALKAIKELSEERFGKLSEAMASGPAAKLASVMDAIGQAARRVGNAILTVLMPVADRLGKFISWLTTSGEIDKAANGISKLFSGQGIGDGLIRIVAYLIATIEELPTIFIVVRSAADNFFTFIKDNLKTIGAIFVASFVFGPIVEGIGLLVAAINTLRTATSFAEIVAIALQAALGGVAGAAKVIAAVGVSILAAYAIVNKLDQEASAALSSSPMQQLSGEAGRIDKRAKGIIGGFAASESGSPTSVLGAVVSGLTGMANPISQIASHTLRTARATEKAANINDAILGGGGIGKAAADAVNVDKSLRGDGGPSGTTAYDRIVRSVREAVIAEITSVSVDSRYADRRGR